MFPNHFRQWLYSLWQCFEMHSLNTLYQRREQRLLNFAVKCVNDNLAHIFPSQHKLIQQRDVQSWLCQNKQIPSTAQCPVPKIIESICQDNPNFIPSWETSSNCFHLIIYDTVLIYFYIFISEWWSTWVLSFFRK